jgi:hypothetical protein
VDGAYAISSAARVAIVASSATAAVGREARLAGGVTAWACTSTTGAGGGDGGDGGGGSDGGGDGDGGGGEGGGGQVPGQQEPSRP